MLGKCWKIGVAQNKKTVMNCFVAKKMGGGDGATKVHGTISFEEGAFELFSRALHFIGCYTG